MTPVGAPPPPVEADLYARAWERELRQAGRGILRKTHLIDALVLTTQALVRELTHARHALEVDNAKRALEYRATIGEVWHWHGDGTDDIDTLTCPILIQPDQLLHLLLRAERA